MELNINRLKALGKKDLNELDKEIKIYSEKNDSILDETLDGLQKKISDSSTFLKSIVSEYNEKKAKLSRYTGILEQINLDYEKYDKLLHESQEETNKIEGEINSRKAEFQKLRDTYENLSQTKLGLEKELESAKNILSALTVKQNEEIASIKTEIQKYVIEIKSKKMEHFTKYNNFAEDINKALVIDTSINEYERIFESKKDDFVRILCRNSENYFNMRRIFQESPDNFHNINEFYTIHNKICGAGDYNCSKCGYTQYKPCGGGGWIPLNTSKYGSCGICHCPKKSQMLRIKGEWIKKVYRVILKDSVKDSELSYLIEQLDYDTLYNLFLNSGVFDVKHFTVFEFVCFLSFIGSDGFPEIFKSFTHINSFWKSRTEYYS
tara:strand:+ start:746 stop:1882 length:1137 start_codon:yes stop_codon:yes gene_type:complete